MSENNKKTEQKTPTLDERIAQMSVEQPAVRDAVVVPGGPAEKKSNKIILALIAGVIIGGLATYFMLHGGTAGGDRNAVAIVDDVRISQEAYDEVYEQVSANATQSGRDVTDPEVISAMNQEVLDVLINTEILKKAASDGGFSVTAEAVDTEYDQIIAQAGGDEVVQQIFAETGLTEASLREDIERQLAIDAYLRSVIGESAFEVSEEEITEALNAIDLEGVEGVTLEDIRPQIEEQLKSVKQQEAIQAHIDALRADAEIEVLI